MPTDVNVVWLTYHETQPAYLYHDQGLLHNLFLRRTWLPANASTFIYRFGMEELPPDAEGAVVVFPARFNQEQRHLVQLQADIDKLKWVVLIISSDEETTFDWQAIKHPNMRLWVSTPRANQDGADYYFGDGYRYECPDILRYYRREALNRDLDWFFAGQRTTNRRNACADALAQIPNGYSMMTQEFAAGLPYPEYLNYLTRAKTAPCPSGAVSHDTFRFYEALEAGCVPIADTVAVNPDTNPGGYWEKLFGENPPFKLIADWPDLPTVLKEVLDDYPVTNNRVFAWWQDFKRQMSYTLEDHIAQVRGHANQGDKPQDKITVIVPTSPIPSHPSTEIIEETMLSIRRQLHEVEIILMIDGVRAELGGHTANYRKYSQRLLWLANHYYNNTVPVLFDSHHHQARMTKAVLEKIRTPLVLFVEHDTPLTGQIPWDSLFDTVQSNEANMIRLHYDSYIHEDHQYLMGGGFKSKSGLPLIRTRQWSQRPHIASTQWYRQILKDNFSDESNTMIEDAMHGRVAESAFKDYKLAIYNPPHNMQRSYHLDGRGSDSKFEELMK